ncbi:IclR family transcriptional regulator, partial [Streptomyces sp. NPDC006356]
MSNYSHDTETSNSQAGGVQSVDRAISVMDDQRGGHDHAGAVPESGGDRLLGRLAVDVRLP